MYYSYCDIDIMHVYQKASFDILVIDRDKVTVTDKGKDQSMGTYLYMEDGNF